ncbi:MULTISPECIES: class II fructose-bisphosphate aldolase [unclassified Chelatococcus]|uniref:class II fructose-bisphosphate aldolase n=1 Tax=unclassified Chelatococcus TaxID=2638111 RepID=UPI001BCE5927|nr:MULTISPECIES: class II fructose-bisphosphate aldolase [unclassified Chelatococcus]CAH1658161.1 Fructose-bisphosphate aldolase 2 [Hyphomicrobiales bacterium]MBS7742210.1 fructose-bisphosphate aldolase class II [Chelatococcus sp. HY11]MBX3542672.1 fructose-bisphosphate aldolase class II [Chelatococcus sp.]MCO5075112.1 fructose-bisphosphate aldolase class II [Chelatococcus sp.]CAH1689623.1 Fructose-bisphosphate aldolase 2 [Hyphomicrobiales bacterium]
MSRITLRQLLDHAAEHQYGVPAFSVTNMEQMLAVMSAADAVDAPVILQVGTKARAYAGDIMIEHLFEALIKMYPHVPLCIHQDHGNSEATCATALQRKFTSVMMDGSLQEDGKTPSDFDYNVRVTESVSRFAHFMGASVEGEIGVLGKLEHGRDERLLTDPDQAVEFVRATKVDALAIAMGTSHGAYKFSRKPDGEVLAMDRLEDIHRRLPDTHLVMHGSSSVPQELQDIMNKYGANIPQTWGVPIEEIQRGIRHGVRKVNIDTDNRMALIGQIRRVMQEDPGEFDIRNMMKPGMDAIAKLCRQRLEEFNTAGHGSKIKVIPMGDMARRYASGALDPKIK